MDYKYNSYVICLNNNTVYQGVREAQRALGVDHSNISKVCRGTRKSVGGLRFQYFDPLIHNNYKYYSYLDYLTENDPSVINDPSVFYFPTARV